MQVSVNVLKWSNLFTMIATQILSGDKGLQRQKES
jgi:hypothetical protein